MKSQAGECVGVLVGAGQEGLSFGCMSKRGLY